jgi:hypothetical protein
MIQIADVPVRTKVARRRDGYDHFVYGILVVAMRTYSGPSARIQPCLPLQKVNVFAAEPNDGSRRDKHFVIDPAQFHLAPLR